MRCEAPRITRLLLALGVIALFAASPVVGGALAKAPQRQHRHVLPAGFPLPGGTKILHTTRVWMTKRDVEYRTIARVRMSRAAALAWYKRHLPLRGYPISGVIAGGLNSWQILFTGHGQIGASSVSMAPRGLGGFGPHALDITLIHRR